METALARKTYLPNEGSVGGLEEEGLQHARRRRGPSRASAVRGSPSRGRRRLLEQPEGAVRLPVGGLLAPRRRRRVASAPPGAKSVGRLSPLGKLADRFETRLLRAACPTNPARSRDRKTQCERGNDARTTGRRERWWSRTGHKPRRESGISPCRRPRVTAPRPNNGLPTKVALLPRARAGSLSGKNLRRPSISPCLEPHRRGGAREQIIVGVRWHGGAAVGNAPRCGALRSPSRNSVSFAGTVAGLSCADAGDASWAFRTHIWSVREYSPAACDVMLWLLPSLLWHP